jgi:hypothetical protein
MPYLKILFQSFSLWRLARSQTGYLGQQHGEAPSYTAAKLDALEFHRNKEVCIPERNDRNESLVPLVLPR